MRARIGADHGRVRRVQDDEALDPLRMPVATHQATRPPQIVPDQAGARPARGLDQADDVLRQDVEIVGGDADRLVAEPYPRWSGATPANRPPQAGICRRRPPNSGKPCSSTTSGPSAGPASTVWSATPARRRRWAAAGTPRVSMIVQPPWDAVAVARPVPARPARLQAAPTLPPARAAPSRPPP